jgi:hypothetical protein
MSYSFVRLQKLTGPKKYEAVLMNNATKREKTIKFGAAGYEDFTMHKDEARKASYISRHQARENWTKTGVDTSGFWSRWLLWNKPTITASLADIKKRFF